jgi:HK97 family phage portal protein
VDAQLIVQPDPELERWDCISRIVTSLALRGNAYLYVLARDRLGYPTAVRVLHPNDVTPFRDGAGHKRFRVRGQERTLDPGEIIHIPLVTLPGALAGLGPIECAQRGIRLAIQTETFGDKWFSEGTAPSSVLESEEPVDPDEANRSLARWVASHGGRRRPAFLSGGLKWKPITVTPNESQFLETRKLNTSQIARIWRVAPHLIGDVEKTTSWGSGIEEQGIGFVVFTLGPYLTRIEAALNRCLPTGQYSKFNVSALLRGNTKDRYLGYAIGRQWGWLNVDDIRALEDLPELPDGAGKTYLQPLNMIDAEAALKKLLLDNAPAPAPAKDPA